MLDGDVNDKEWDKNDNKNVAESDDDTHILLKWGSL